MTEGHQNRSLKRIRGYTIDVNTESWRDVNNGKPETRGRKKRGGGHFRFLAASRWHAVIGPGAARRRLRPQGHPAIMAVPAHSMQSATGYAPLRATMSNPVIGGRPQVGGVLVEASPADPLLRTSVS